MLYGELCIFEGGQIHADALARAGPPMTRQQERRPATDVSARVFVAEVGATESPSRSVREVTSAGLASGRLRYTGR